jgi:hypothetical protein
MDRSVQWQGRCWRICDLGEERINRYGVLRRYVLEARSKVGDDWRIVRRLSYGEELDSLLEELLAAVRGQS